MNLWTLNPEPLNGSIEDIGYFTEKLNGLIKKSAIFSGQILISFHFKLIDWEILEPIEPPALPSYHPITQAPCSSDCCFRTHLPPPKRGHGVGKSVCTNLQFFVLLEHFTRTPEPLGRAGRKPVDPLKIAISFWDDLIKSMNNWLSESWGCRSFKAAKGEAVVCYCKSLVTQKMEWHRLSQRVNKMERLLLK